MYYSFDFAANVTRLCMEEIRQRGLLESKIFRKSRPNNDLFVKTFTKQICKKEDLSYVDIHSVATLMQDALWSSQERLIPKKAWRVINYETCTLSNLSSVIDARSERLLIDILSFLVELMQHKKYNQMDAYKLGDALGKVVLGPADCSTIIAEKAGHFLTRLIIEYAKVQSHQKRTHYLTADNDEAFNSFKFSMPPSITSRNSVDSAISLSSSITPPPNEYQRYFANNNDGFAYKLQGTKARAKYYDRIISKIKRSGSDWFDNTDGLQALLDSDYKYSLERHDNPYISIFTPAEELKQQYRKSNLEQREDPSPIIYRILMKACQPNANKTAADSDSAIAYFFDNPSESSSTTTAERQIREAFDDFRSHKAQTNNILALQEPGEKENPLKKLNHSLSNLKLNYRKYRSTSQNLNHLLVAESAITEHTEATAVDLEAEPTYYNEVVTTEHLEKPLPVIQKIRYDDQQYKDGKDTHVHACHDQPQPQPQRLGNARPMRKMMKKMIKIAANVGQQEKDRRSSKVVR